VMKALAKLGFSQSYTYFTWRTGKQELQAYLSEITGYPEREYEAVAPSGNYRSEITSPLRSAATISPAWRPASVSTAPFWLVSTIPPAPGPTATPAPAAP
jgi:hypothetical protein